MYDLGFPQVPGLTETADESKPLYERLMDMLSSRPGGSSQHLTEAIAVLENAYGSESDSTLRSRIAAAREMLYGLGDDDTEEDGDYL